MTSVDPSALEKTKPDFSLDEMLKAREKTILAMQEIAAEIHPGMLEEQATELAESILKKMGCTRKWHRSWIRFGENTLLPYGVLSQPKTQLREEDIFFLDLGPVWEGYEGDAGATYVRGENKPELQRCADDVKKIFDQVALKWKQEKWSGIALYEYAAELASSLGWQLNLNTNGHRLSDFPHALYHKGSIDKLPFTPSSGLWVLEIQIRHPQLPFGAFYEDLMI